MVTEKYNGGAHGMREHILRMSNMAAKLKPMDDDLELKPALLVHLVMASLPQQFDIFVIYADAYSGLERVRIHFYSRESIFRLCCAHG
jgi:hypothetical protein